MASHDAGPASVEQRLAEARARLQRLAPRAAAAASAAGAILVDIRPVDVRRRAGEVPGALIIDRNVLEWRLDPASPDRVPEITRHDQPIVVFCTEGYASSFAAVALKDLGLVNATDLDGGFVAWEAAGLPVLRAVPAPGLRSQLDDATSGLDVEPLTGTIGAVINGIDLAAPLAAEVVADVRAALLRYRVIFFRDQSLTPTQQVTFGRRFGPLTPAHPLVGGLDSDHPEVLVLDSRDYPLGVGTRGKGTSYNNRWHTDVTFSEHPPMGAILSAKDVPARGGDTLWADLVDAYGTLSAPSRRALDGLVAVHDASSTFERYRDEDPTGQRQTTLASLEPVFHPVVRVHPETGERALFVNPTFTRRIDGLSPRESRAFLALLYDHMTQPERTVRWRWRTGDVAFWDNRATAHYAVADYGTAPRLMHRITIAGDRPVGPPAAAAEAG